MGDRVHDASDSSEDSSGVETWIEWFCEQQGNEFLCEVDRRFIEDSFNLVGFFYGVERLGAGGGREMHKGLTLGLAVVALPLPPLAPLAPLAPLSLSESSSACGKR